ncbi:MAG TPA: TIGR04442 family protein [Thermoanaerobaculia bacterium]|nr:TIGR04442 family protein [Thermoanaerobaculia bacterium]
MINAIVHHGFISDAIEYFATVTGPGLDRKFYFEQISDGRGQIVRYFGGHSEVALQGDGVSFTGNGGIFSEYMFGGHFPVQDLLNDEVVNRLGLFGGMYDPATREFRFTSQTSGFETYEELFFHGNAVANHFFFIDDHSPARGIPIRQEKTIRTIGKLLKRSNKVGRGHFLDLAHEIHDTLNEPHSTLFLIRIVHRPHQSFHERCRLAYHSQRSFGEMVATTGDGDSIDPYQRERIQIDVVYHHPDNQQLIDEYKRVLAACSGSRIGPSERARLMRLRTLSLRNNIPLSIFDTLEDIVLQDQSALSEGEIQQEPPYIQSTREILEGFRLGKSVARKLAPSDMLTLVENKQKAVSSRDQTFEEILLETGRSIDEAARTEQDFERMESFGELITLFDRIDHTSMLVNKLGFMEDVEISPEQVRSILGNMHVFEELRRGLFQSLFIDPVVANEYTLSYGRRKLFALMLGLMQIDQNESTIQEVADEIATINRHERAYFALYRLARRRMTTFYLELNTAEGRETFRREIAGEASRDPEMRELQSLIDDKLIDDVITKIRMEAFYINQLLPRIVDEVDSGLRSDFLVNSGLDRFQIEDLEEEYFDMRAFPPQLLQVIRQP